MITAKPLTAAIGLSPAIKQLVRKLDNLGFELYISGNAKTQKITVTHPVSCPERTFTTQDFELFASGVLAGVDC